MSDGIGCECAARAEGECCCGVDWRSAREVELEAETRYSRQALEDIVATNDGTSGDHLDTLNTCREIAEEALKRISTIKEELPPVCSKCHQWECICATKMAIKTNTEKCPECESTNIRIDDRDRPSGYLDGYCLDCEYDWLETSSEQEDLIAGTFNPIGASVLLAKQKKKDFLQTQERADVKCGCIAQSIAQNGDSK